MKNREYLWMCILFAVLALVAVAGLFFPLAGRLMLIFITGFYAILAMICWREYRIRKD